MQGKLGWKKKFLYGTLTALMLVSFLGLSSEIILRALWSPKNPRKVQRFHFDEKLSPSQGIVHIPGEYNYSMRRCSGKPIRCEKEQIKITINKYRTRETGNPKREGKPLIFILGDSMIEAAQVSDSKTAVSRLEHSLRKEYPQAQCLNLGMTSTGFVHYYYRWKHYQKMFQPDLVVVVTLGINDFRNSSTELETFLAQKPFYSKPSGTSGLINREAYWQDLYPKAGPVRKLISKSRKKTEISRFLKHLQNANFTLEKPNLKQLPRHGSGWFPDCSIYLTSLPPPWKEAVQESHYWFTKLAREVKQSGARFQVVYLPWSGESIDSLWENIAQDGSKKYPKEQIDRWQPEKLIGNWAREERLTFSSFAKALRQYSEDEKYRLWHFGNDSHLTEYGNAQLAEFIRNQIVRDSL